MSDKNPLDPIRASHEEEYFHRKNQMLIERLRQQLKQADEAGKLSATTGIHDPDLMAWLAELGITADNAPILHLVPLFQVAWADGAIQPAERELLEQAAVETGVLPGTAAQAAFEQLLKAPPGARLLRGRPHLRPSPPGRPAARGRRKRPREPPELGASGRQGRRWALRGHRQGGRIGTHRPASDLCPTGGAPCRFRNPQEHLRPRRAHAPSRSVTWPHSRRSASPTVRTPSASRTGTSFLCPTSFRANVSASR